MQGKWRDSGFSMLTQEIADKQGGKAKMTHVVME